MWQNPRMVRSTQARSAPPSRVGLFGWGLVAPRSPNIDAFRHNLECATSWLGPFNGFGPDNFLVGWPEFDFSAYKPWIDARFPPNRFPQLADKMDLPAQYAIGAFIQALSQNPGIEEVLTSLGSAAHVYIGSGVGAIGTIHDESLALYRAQRRWNRFWAAEERNAALASYRRGSADREAFSDVPPDPAAEEHADPEARDQMEGAWWAYWAARSPQLVQYLESLAEIERLPVEGDVEAGKLRMIKEKQRRRAKLERTWGAPEPPWSEVSANLIWNIHNIPAAQVSMLGNITGLSFAPVAACSTFGVALKLALDAIRRGEAKAVVVGATDPPPHPLLVGAFYKARVISADRAVSKPLTELRGTHVAGGSVVWIVGDYEEMTERGFTPVGMEPLGVGVSSDADHIITPSVAGPRSAIEDALSEAEVPAEAVSAWDLHATATPGDFQEVENLRQTIPEPVLVTARKGIFGHGMAAGGGWELTAQYLGYERGSLFPVPLEEGEVNAAISALGESFVFERPLAAPAGVAGKLSMGIGGVNACVLSRPWDKDESD